MHAEDLMIKPVMLMIESADRGIHAEKLLD